uniref:Uncharacterized protein n=1 Tax=Gopherus evgoodei TaxID=1825980 RepID=A0A8C4WQK2_9SAUR
VELNNVQVLRSPNLAPHHLSHQPLGVSCFSPSSLYTPCHLFCIQEIQTRHLVLTGYLPVPGNWGSAPLGTSVRAFAVSTWLHCLKPSCSGPSHVLSDTPANSVTLVGVVTTCFVCYLLELVSTRDFGEASSCTEKYK